jgi:hypothetical protein
VLNTCSDFSEKQEKRENSFSPMKNQPGSLTGGAEVLTIGTYLSDTKLNKKGWLCALPRIRTQDLLDQGQRNEPLALGAAVVNVEKHLSLKDSA